MPPKRIFSPLHSAEFYRYIAVGVVNTLFGYGLFSLFIYADLHYSIALFSATVLGVLFNFKSIGLLVFRSYNNKLIFRFIAVYVFLYCINLLFLKFFALLNINMYFGGALLLPVTAVIGFLINKRFVFNNEEAH